MSVNSERIFIFFCYIMSYISQVKWTIFIFQEWRNKKFLFNCTMVSSGLDSMTTLTLNCHRWVLGFDTWSLGGVAYRGKAALKNFSETVNLFGLAHRGTTYSSDFLLSSIEHFMLKVRYWDQFHAAVVVRRQQFALNDNSYTCNHWANFNQTSQELSLGDPLRN